GGQAIVQGSEEADEAAAVQNDGAVDFVPERPAKLAGADAEIEADIDDDLTDRPATHLGGDFSLSRKTGETRVLGARDDAAGFGADIRRRSARGGLGARRRGKGYGRRQKVLAARGTLAEHGVQRRSAAQTAGDAGQDHRDVGGAEGSGEKGEARCGGALLDGDGDLLAAVDQLADQAQDTAEGGRRGCAGPRRIGIGCWDGRLDLGTHERNKNTDTRG